MPGVRRSFVLCCVLAGLGPIGGCDGDRARGADAGAARHDAGADGSVERGSVDAGAPGAPDAGGHDAGGPDAGRVDAGGSGPGGNDAGHGDAGDADAGSADAGSSAATLYPDDRVLSPVTESVVDAVRSIASGPQTLADDVFLKVGASTSVSTSYLACFAGSAVDLGAHAALQNTLDRFAQGDAAGTDPFGRDSLAAQAGWSVSAAIAGDPSPLELEMEATGARFGLVNFGMNDNLSTEASLESFANDARTLVDRLIDGGVVPIVLGTQARADSAAANDWVETFNAALRAIAQARQVPFVDLHRALESVTDDGLAGDGVHLNADAGGACLLTSAGLDHGYNVLNLNVLQALDRTVAVLEDAPAPDSTVPLAGMGTTGDPLQIPWLPFSHEGDTHTAEQSDYDEYGGCSALQDESGPEYVYSLVLDAATALRIAVLSETDADLDVHLLDETAEVAGCLARSDRMIAGTLAAGTYYVVVDTFVSSGTPEPGTYLLIVQPCEAGDATCTGSIP